MNMLNATALNHYKDLQKESWGLFAPLEIFTTMPAAQLVKFAALQSKQNVLDVGCGTGVVALTAARLGCKTTGLDLSPALIERARENATLAEMAIEFLVGDVETLPFPDNHFDVVLSQFGHMFAPRPEVAIQEMIRVLKPKGRLAFSTWPSDLYMGRLFRLVSQYSPPPEGVSSPTLWGDTTFVRQHIEKKCGDITFDTGVMIFPALSLNHYKRSIEKTVGPVLKLVQDSQQDDAKLQQFRCDLSDLASGYYRDNHLQQHFLMTKAVKL